MRKVWILQGSPLTIKVLYKLLNLQTVSFLMRKWESIFLSGLLLRTKLDEI